MFAFALTFAKETLLKLKTHIEPQIIIVREFNSTLSPTDRSLKETTERQAKLSEVMNQMDFTDICRTFYSQTKEYSLFSEPHLNFSKIDHVIGQNPSLNRYKKIEINPCILSDDHELRLYFNKTKTTENTHTHGN
jgi:exonuclease III